PHMSISPTLLIFFFHPSAHPPALHSFPTRRSSDLDRVHESSEACDGARLVYSQRRRADHLVGAMKQIPRSSVVAGGVRGAPFDGDRKSTRLNSSHVSISYAVFCLKKKNKKYHSDQ